MPSITGPEMIEIEEDILDACDKITRADAARTALPNRVLYDLVAEFDYAVGGRDLRFRDSLTLGGSMLGAGLSLMQKFNAHEFWGEPQEKILFNLIDKQLQAAGVSFTPKYQGWLNSRAAP